MYSREHRTAKTPSHKTDTAATNRFAPPRFVYHPKVETATPQAEQTTDLQAESENSESLDSSCLKPGILSPRFTKPQPRQIQMKLNLGLFRNQQAVEKAPADVVQRMNTPLDESIQPQELLEKKQRATPQLEKTPDLQAKSENVKPDPFEAAPLLPNPRLAAWDIGKTAKIPAGKEFYKLSNDGSKKKAQPRSQDLIVKVENENDGGYIFSIAKVPEKFWVAKENIKQIVQSGFKKIDVPLFPPDPKWKPSPDDVRQLGIGDCYLGAALASIAAQKPEYIKEIVREDKDGNVTVRLYKVNRQDYQHPKFTPQYIKVEKSIPQDEFGIDLYSNGALWVRMIQKAYAAGGFTGTPRVFPLQPLNYLNIDSGFSSYAFEALLGKPSTILGLKSGPTYNKKKIQYEDGNEIVAKDNTKEIITPIK
ncbi:hypothetical protein Cylst_1265 [Cylindrospermum stagnale PCC 7417]|uniref:Calpain catalytic domain-containing protein n=1 Tax=Cylindrospermum stagnale PCC 7417 TaxID=56107 RepID=K9WTN8_9NOST|nr:hypothetical protein [Cylindrospermum stagnale]AFZ23558.1 hypothetical protein Cylst_1265 [Cylindrospermum stagnale PCC 7417]